MYVFDLYMFDKWIKFFLLVFLIILYVLVFIIDGIVFYNLNCVNIMIF